MNLKKHHITTANEAVARIAYKTNEVFPIYPITPASEMAELVEKLSAQNEPNIFGSVPNVFQMQSEAGVAGAMHGSIQTGSLSSTFTASQGLLLMLPNMYKIAGELTPNVIHVATRTIASHALSVFGDHSDIMAVRQSGYAFLGAGSVQEAQDFALIAQIASINSNIPFVHFFDGFRTSHETTKIEAIPDQVITSLINSKNIRTFRKRALNPNSPVIRGTAQGPDQYFQNREAANPFFNNCPNIVQNSMDQFAVLTGRQYQLFEYTGHPEATHIIISMASSTETIEETISHLNNQGEKIGLVKVRLFRPFSTKHLITALPKTAKTITVLDRTKESGSIADPLCLDISQSLMANANYTRFERIPKVIGGRYGLSSKEFTPNMVHAIVANAKAEIPKQQFTIGIHDDITNLSLNYNDDNSFSFNGEEVLFYLENAKKKTKSLNTFLSYLAETQYVQAYTECSYNKSKTKNICHVRTSNQPIKAPYLITNANTSIVEKLSFLDEEIIAKTASNGSIIILSSKNKTEVYQSLKAAIQRKLIEKNITLFIANPHSIIKNKNSAHHEISVIHLLGIMRLTNRTNDTLKPAIMNELQNLTLNTVSEMDKDLLTGKLELSTSMLPPDGTFQTNTSQFNDARTSEDLVAWNPDACTQCGACSMACPLGALRIKAFDDKYLTNAPSTFKWTASMESDWEVDLLNYTIQINPEQCNGCNNCVDACDYDALKLVSRVEVAKEEALNWSHFEDIPELDRNKINPAKLSQQQLQEPLFKYALGVDGCGEAPYLKLLSQLYGDRLLVANATGASSIFGGALPTTPWAKNKDGKGPAWSNSLFEDNAEFGLGYRISINYKKEQAIALLKKLKTQLPYSLVQEILNAQQKTELQINAQRKRIVLLNRELSLLNSFEGSQLLSLTQYLIEKSVWIIGGDGWAYDIGFGGIDHVLASGKNVNILVLDNQVYDNTGGQTSKATPFGAKAVFSHNGKQTRKKDLGKFAMMYKDVYVASVALGANKEQTLRAFNEAESFNGPSIIIGYCHSDAHGIDMKNPSQYHKAIVNSGAWSLYRRDPRNSRFNVPTLQLDSAKPSIDIETYLKSEARFKDLIANKNNEVIDRLQAEFDKQYTALATIAEIQDYELEKT